jgi:hypothetical protein
METLGDGTVQSKMLPGCSDGGSSGGNGSGEPEGGVAGRRVLCEYGLSFLDQMMAVATATTVIAYLMYTVSDETVARFGSRALIYTTPFVIYGIFRYLYILHQRDGGGDPAVAVAKDGPMLINFLLWVTTTLFIIY